MTSDPIQQSLPTIGPAPLVAGPVFLCFELAGKPPHKARPRGRVVIPRQAWTWPQSRSVEPFITKAGAKMIFFTMYADPTTEAHEKAIRDYASLLMRHRAATTKPIALLVHAFTPIPVSWSARDREEALAGAIRPTGRPDWDNYGKICDALNKGVVWHDDAQVVDGRVIKIYSDQPALRIEIREFVPP